MPFILTDESIFEKRHVCVVCPYKINKLFSYEDVDRIIYKKAGFKTLENAFKEKNTFEVGKVIRTKGFNLCQEILHIICPDWIYDPDFEMKLFNAYNDVIKTIKERHYPEVVIPIFKYCYKRTGDVHNYRTAKLMLQYFARQYDLNNVTVFIVVKKQVVLDHKNNYRYKPKNVKDKETRSYAKRKYPLSTNFDFWKFLRKNNIKLNPTGFIVNRYHHVKQKFPFDELFEYINDRCFRYTEVFCYKSQLNMENYNGMFDFSYYPSKDELLGMCIGLKLTYDETIDLFKKSKYELDFDDKKDCLVLSHINTKNYDIFEINEILYIEGIRQIYSNPLEMYEKVAQQNN